MCIYNLYLFAPDFLKWLGFWLAITGLAGQGIVVFILPTRRSFERLLRLGLVGVAIFGVALNRIGDMEKSAPRHLAECQANKISSAIKPYSGQIFQMVTYENCEECSSTFIMIYDILIKAAWVREGPPQGMPIGAMQSVLIYANDDASEQTKKAAMALATALNNEGVSAKLRSGDSNKAVVDIIVGLKP